MWFWRAFDKTVPHLLQQRVCPIHHASWIRAQDYPGLLAADLGCGDNIALRSVQRIQADLRSQRGIRIGRSQPNGDLSALPPQHKLHIGIDLFKLEAGQPRMSGIPPI